MSMAIHLRCIRELNLTMKTKFYYKIKKLFKLILHYIINYSILDLSTRQTHKIHISNIMSYERS